MGSLKITHSAKVCIPLLNLQEYWQQSLDILGCLPIFGPVCLYCTSPVQAASAWQAWHALEDNNENDLSFSFITNSFLAFSRPHHGGCPEHQWWRGPGLHSLWWGQRLLPLGWCQQGEAPGGWPRPEPHHPPAGELWHLNIDRWTDESNVVYEILKCNQND